MSKVSLRAKDFKRARATFTQPSITVAEYDQVGLLSARPLSSLPDPSATNPGDALSTPYYIKFWLEVIGGQPVIAMAGSNHHLD